MFCWREDDGPALNADRAAFHHGGGGGGGGGRRGQYPYSTYKCFWIRACSRITEL